MLPELFGSRPADRALCRRHLRKDVLHLKIIPTLVRDIDDGFATDKLRIIEHVTGAVDSARRYAVPLHELIDLAHRLRLCPVLDQRVQLLLIFSSCRVRAVIRIVCEIGLRHCLA